jgi:hypothetical protein
MILVSDFYNTVIIPALRTSPALPIRCSVLRDRFTQIVASVH